MFAVFVEALLVLALLLAAQPAQSTDLVAMSAAAAGSDIWQRARALVRRCWRSRSSSLAETGRQPIDNPDTHLELTMIHEGPLLEYAGRDLAYLQWAAAARHWVVLVLAGELFLPHWGPFGAAPAAARRRRSPCSARALAVVETAQAKMRILRVPGAARARRG